MPKFDRIGKPDPVFEGLGLRQWRDPDGEISYLGEQASQRGVDYFHAKARQWSAENRAVEPDAVLEIRRLLRGWMQRCTNPRATKYHRYGGRGIRVYASWQADIRNGAWEIFGEVGARPSKAHSIDRIDKDGDYEPGNLRWADPKVQASNRHPAERAAPGQMTMAQAERAARAERKAARVAAKAARVAQLEADRVPSYRELLRMSLSDRCRVMARMRARDGW